MSATSLLPPMLQLPGPSSGRLQCSSVTSLPTPGTSPIISEHKHTMFFSPIFQLPLSLGPRGHIHLPAWMHACSPSFPDPLSGFLSSLPWSPLSTLSFWDFFPFHSSVSHSCYLPSHTHLPGSGLCDTFWTHDLRLSESRLNRVSLEQGRSE